MVLTDRVLKTKPLTSATMNAIEDEVLLFPDESLASHASLVSMAIHPAGPPVSENVKTLVMPDTAVFTGNVAASLPDCNNTMFRVRKIRPTSADDVSLFSLFYSFVNFVYVS